MSSSAESRFISRRGFMRAALGSCAVAASAFAGCAGSGSGAASMASSSATASATPSGAQAGQIPQSAQQYEQISKTLFVFDTVVTLVASCSQETLDELGKRCEYFESKFSRTIADSDIGRINAAGGEPVEVAPETADIIQKALRYCEESGGLFDITIGAATTLWDFKEGVKPDDAELAEAVKHVDYTKVALDGETVTLLDPDAKLDLGGIAKGYIADDLCARLIEAGCDSGYVNLGGNVKTVGVRPDGNEWHVGIQDPNDEHGTVVAAVYSTDSSIVTSGLYERQFDLDGKRYWHILDPATGYPVETDLISATILSGASIDGDGYTKPLFLMGHDEALAWIEAKEGVEGLVVDMDQSITQSSGCNAELV